MTKRRIMHPHVLSREEKEKKQQPSHVRCAHCGELVQPGEGGMQHIPAIVSNRPAEEVALHNKCLCPYLDAVMLKRPKLPVAFPDKQKQAAGR